MRTITAAMGQLIVDTPSHQKVSQKSAEGFEKVTHNESARSDASVFDIIDGVGVLEDSVFEGGDPKQGSDASPAQLREMVLKTLFTMLATHLGVLTVMVGVAVFVDAIRYYLATDWIIVYIAFFMLPVVHCIPMLCSPAKSMLALALFVIVLGYVEAVLSCIYNTYCIFMTNIVCLATCVQVVLLSIVGVQLCSMRTLALVVVLHVVNFIGVVVTVSLLTVCSWPDIVVAAVAAVFLPTAIVVKIRRIVTHFSPDNYV